MAALVPLFRLSVMTSVLTSHRLYGWVVRPVSEAPDPALRRSTPSMTLPCTTFVRSKLKKFLNAGSGLLGDPKYPTKWLSLSSLLAKEVPFHHPWLRPSQSVLEAVGMSIELDPGLRTRKFTSLPVNPWTNSSANALLLQSSSPSMSTPAIFFMGILPSVV